MEEEIKFNPVDRKVYIMECLQCGEVFFVKYENNHRCKQLNKKLKDIMHLGTLEEIADASIDGVCRIIGCITLKKTVDSFLNIKKGDGL